MKLVKQIPNLLTLGNLFCGTVATIFAVQGNFESTAIFVILGIVFDFFDGFAARLLNVTGELGKQLDSLADMVTSGIAPGIVMFKLIEKSEIINNGLHHKFSKGLAVNDFFSDVRILGLLLVLGACYRLAKFNIDTRQSNSFIGLPTPAMSLFVISLPLIQLYCDIEFIQTILSNNYFLISITLLLTYLMNAEIPLFSLKFKNYSISNNKIKYIFLLVSLGLIVALQFLAVPLIIILYVLISLFTNRAKE